MPDPDSPRVLRAELTRLDAVINAGFELPDARSETGAVALVLLRQIAVNAEAVLAISETQVAEAAIANLRTMFEAWCQLRYLLKCTPDSEESAVTCQAFSLLEFRAWLESESASAEEVAPLNEAIEVLRKRHAAGVQSAEDLRSGVTKGKNSKYWTGLGPTALVREVSAGLPDPGHGPKFYKFTSWDAHVIMAPILEITRTTRDGLLHLEMGPRQPPEEAAAVHCGAALELLRDSWGLARTGIPLSPKPSEPPQPPPPRSWWRFWQ